MNNTKKPVFNWSGGKDSALALQKVLANNDFEVIALLTTITKGTNKSSVHAIPLHLLQQQAKSIGIKLYVIEVNNDLSNYITEISKAVEIFKQQQVTHFIFGDLSSSNIFNYRKKIFNPLKIEVVEPLYNKTSQEVMEDFLSSGIKAKIIVANYDIFSKDIIGKDLNSTCINTMPKGIDICGEQGEYHSFVYEGSIFKTAIKYKIKATKKVAYDIKLDNNKIKTFTYWQAIIE